MNDFWNLVGFEYKKIFKKKSIIILFVLSLVLTAILCNGTLLGNYYVDGKPVESKLESMQKDREYEKALSGRNIDGELLLEASRAYAKIPPLSVGAKYSLTEEYELYARPYSSIMNIMIPVYNTSTSKFDLKDMQNLTEEQANSFYDIRHENLQRTIYRQSLSDKSKQKIMQLDEKIKKPFVMQYAGGYERYFALMYITGMIISFLLAVCLAPIFAGEYGNRTDQLILSSKSGKRTLIYSKIFTGVSLSVLFSTLFTAVTYFGCLMIYGFEGFNAPFQLGIPLCSYPLSMGQVAIVFFICVLFANILIAAITMLLSAKAKSPFGVIVTVSILIIIPMFINVSETNVLLHNLVHLFPTNMMALWTITSPILYEIFGLSIEPYIFMPIFAAFASVVLLPFAYKGFKNHQVG